MEENSREEEEEERGSEDSMDLVTLHIQVLVLLIKHAGSSPSSKHILE